MRVSKEKAAANRQDMLTAAARLFREQGVSATGVDAITKDAHLTHGAVYSHFGSKEAIAAEAIRLALQGSQRRWQRLVERKGAEKAFAAIVAEYLSPSSSGRCRSGLCRRRPWQRDRPAVPERARCVHRGVEGRARILGWADARGRSCTQIRGRHRRIWEYGWRADARAGRGRRAPVGTNTPHHGQTDDPASSCACTRATHKRKCGDPQRSLEETLSVRPETTRRLDARRIICGTPKRCTSRLEGHSQH